MAITISPWHNLNATHFVWFPCDMHFGLNLCCTCLLIYLQSIKIMYINVIIRLLSLMLPLLGFMIHSFICTRHNFCDWMKSMKESNLIVWQPKPVACVTTKGRTKQPNTMKLNVFNKYLDANLFNWIKFNSLKLNRSNGEKKRATKNSVEIECDYSTFHFGR